MWTVGYGLITLLGRKILCVPPSSELSWALVTLSICSLVPNQGQMEPQRLTWLHTQLQLFIRNILLSPFFSLFALNRCFHHNPFELKPDVLVVYSRRRVIFPQGYFHIQPGRLLNCFMFTPLIKRNEKPWTWLSSGIKVMICSPTIPVIWVTD